MEQGPLWKATNFLKRQILDRMRTVSEQLANIPRDYNAILGFKQQLHDE
jgi:hypothetical protein